MAFILNLALAFGSLIAISDSACKLHNLQITNPRFPPKGCFDDGEFHPFFSTWESDDCGRCGCDKRGMECCNQNKIAVGYNPKMCMAYFVKETCTFKVVRIKDPSIDCKFKTVELNSDSSDSSDSEDSNTKEKSRDKSSSNASPDNDSSRDKSASPDNDSSRDKSASADLDNWEDWDAEDYAEYFRSMESDENEYASESYNDRK